MILFLELVSLEGDFCGMIWICLLPPERGRRCFPPVKRADSGTPNREQVELERSVGEYSMRSTRQVAECFFSLFLYFDTGNEGYVIWERLHSLDTHNKPSLAGGSQPRQFWVRVMQKCVVLCGSLGEKGRSFIIRNDFSWDGFLKYGKLLGGQRQLH